MPVLKLNLKEAVSLKPLENGTYSCEVSEVGDAKETEKAVYAPLTLVVTEGDSAGHKLFYNLILAGKGAGIGADFLSKALGEEIDIDELDDYEFDSDDLIGAEIRVVCKQREYPEGSGEMRDNIEKVLKA